MAVSGEFKYFGPAFSSVASVRPVNAMTRPLSLAMGNMTRLRNLEYIEGRALELAEVPLASGVVGRWPLAISWPGPAGRARAPVSTRSAAGSGARPGAGEGV